APRGHDRDVVEAVAPTSLLPAPDLYLHDLLPSITACQARLWSRADEKTPVLRGRNAAICGVRGVDPNALSIIENYATPAGTSSSRTSTRGSSRSTSRGSIVPAPKCCVDSAPHATPNARQSRGGEPA